MASWLGFVPRIPHYPDSIYIALFPSFFIFLTVLCFNFVGDGLRDALDPRGIR